MANALIVRPRSNLLFLTSAGRAAQYVRMSTDHQRYSTQNQAAAIAVYAAQHDLLIVRTYADEGRSGLRIDRREGLIALIEDVRSGRADFDHILVYDDGKIGHDAFAVIRETIREMNKVAIGRVVLTNREHIIALEPLDKGLMGTLLRYPYEVRSEQEYFDEIQDVRVTKDMLDLGEAHREPEVRAI
jgi:Resolvase, N terminal domain/Ku70/Ku80 beta-barrel domain